MPCCGLSEQRSRVPLRFTLAGIAVFSGAFVAGSTLGILLCWTRLGRGVLRAQWQFVLSLWRESMRQRDSTFSRWACRLSGRLLLRAPNLAELVYRRPEIPALFVATFALVVALGGGYLLFGWLAQSLPNPFVG